LFQVHPMQEQVGENTPLSDTVPSMMTMLFRIIYIHLVIPLLLSVALCGT
jgi:hypothetical protein